MTSTELDMTSTELPSDALVDPVCGLIRELVPVEPHADLPPRYLGVIAEVADSRHFGAWSSDRVALGTTFGDPDGARRAAIGEAVERYCGNYVPAGLRRATAGELAAEDEAHLGPAELPFFAPWQFERDRFPFVPFTDELPVLWTCGQERGAGACWVPASFAYLNWRTGPRRREPRINHLNYAGIATGVGLADAELRGLLELVERDALSLWWHLDGPARGIALRSLPALAAEFDSTALRCHLLELPTEFGVPVVTALVHDELRGIAAGGFAARFDVAEAATKAALEAIHSWVFTQGLLDADGWVFRAIEAGVLARGLYLPYRADRRYLEDAGEDFAAVRDLGAQAQVWLDPQVQRTLLPRFSDPPVTVDASEIAAGTEDGLRRRLEQRGHRTVVCDLTTPDVAETPLRVVRVCVSGLVPNAPAAFPYFGYPRWSQAALERGWRTTAPDRHSLLLAPPPSL